MTDISQCCVLIVSHGQSESMTALGSYSQADEDSSSPTCCPRPQTSNKNCGSTEDETFLDRDTRDC